MRDRLNRIRAIRVTARARGIERARMVINGGGEEVWGGRCCAAGLPVGLRSWSVLCWSFLLWAREGGTAVAATMQESTSSRDAYVKAMIPVAEEVLSDFGRAGVDDYSCLADQYLQRFTLRRLRAVGSPATVRREMLKDTFDLNLFNVTEAQQTRILTTAVWECLGIGRMLGWSAQRRGVELSQSSIGCVQAKFDSEPKTEDAYIEAVIRRSLGKPKPTVATEAAVRSGYIMLECLTPEELAGVRG